MLKNNYKAHWKVFLFYFFFNLLGVSLFYGLILIIDITKYQE